MRKFVYRDGGRLLPNNREGGRRDEEVGPKAQGEEVRAGWEIGLRGPMGTNEANRVMNVENVASAPTMYNMEAGAEGSSLAPSQFVVQVATAPHH